MSKYECLVGQNERSGSSAISLLDKSEALEWCEQHDIDADDIEKEFDIQEG